MFDKPRWRGYDLHWCDLCECATIVCSKCGLGSCSGGGCEKCDKDFTEFLKQRIMVESYLSPQEIEAYHKGVKLRRLIVKSLSQDESQINWKALQEAGEFSRHDEEMFSRELGDVDHTQS